MSEANTKMPEPTRPTLVNSARFRQGGGITGSLRDGTSHEFLSEKILSTVHASYFRLLNCSTLSIAVKLTAIFWNFINSLSI